MEDRPDDPVRGRRHVVTAPRDTAGDRLDRVLAGALPALSRARLKALILAGHVSLAAGAQRGAWTIFEPSHRVKPGQNFAIFVPEAASSPEPVGEAIPLTIVHEDAQLLVVNKQAGLVVHPAPGNPTGTLVNALIAHCGAGLSGIGGVRRPGIVHRLDKATSGLMVIAKTEGSHASLAAQFKARTIERAYTALVWGRPPGVEGAVEANVGRSPRDRKKMAVRAAGGRPALTRWRLLRAAGRAASVLECRLATGRTHQIRVHLAHLGLPVIGDATYGGGVTPARRALIAEDAARLLAGLERQALHAHRLGFVHPQTGRGMRFVADMPCALVHLENVLHNT